MYPESTIGGGTLVGDRYVYGNGASTRRGAGLDRHARVDDPTANGAFVGDWTDAMREIEIGNQGYVPNFTGEKAAQLTRSWIANSEWIDYNNRYAPREEALVQRVTGEGATQELNRRLGEIRATTNSSFGHSLINTMNRMRRYGIGFDGLSPEAQAQARNEGGASMALSRINAENNVRQHITDRNMNMIAGSGDVINRKYEYGT